MIRYQIIFLTVNFKRLPIYDESNRTNYGTVFTKGLDDVSEAFKKKGSISPASIL